MIYTGWKALSLLTRNQGSGIRDQGSGIRDQEIRVPQNTQRRRECGCPRACPELAEWVREAHLGFGSWGIPLSDDLCILFSVVYEGMYRFVDSLIVNMRSRGEHPRILFFSGCSGAPRFPDPYSLFPDFLSRGRELSILHKWFIPSSFFLENSWHGIMVQFVILDK